jgi:hypothetical protein
MEKSAGVGLSSTCFQRMTLELPWGPRSEEPLYVAFAVQNGDDFYPRRRLYTIMY